MFSNFCFVSLAINWKRRAKITADPWGKFLNRREFSAVRFQQFKVLHIGLQDTKGCYGKLWND